MKNRYQKTIYACFCGYIVQAAVNNFVPLLFLTFHRIYGISMGKITFLIAINFGIQLMVDILSAFFVDKIGYRISIVTAHLSAAGGFVLLTILPELLSDPFVGILIAVMIYAVGGGLLEVLVSPIMESCPTKNKEKAMSLLHSFYCWGQAGVVLISTVFFHVVGIGYWKILAIAWAVIPVVNALVFTKAPLGALFSDGQTGLSMKALFGQKLFWILMLMMLCAGASELSVSQWASTFAEQGLGVSKAAGDLAGPMAFALMQGAARVYYGKYGDKINLDYFMLASGILCAFSYLTISLAPFPFISLIGCAICGFSVGIMWPGTFSRASAAIPGGGTMLFALLALAGDMGASGGPALTGLISSAASDNLKMGILAGTIFPVIMTVSLLVCRKKREIS